VGEALSKDLRQRVVDAYRRGEGSYRQLADRFGLGEASVNRYLRLLRETGDVERRPRGGGTTPKVSDEELPALAAFVAKKPDRTAEELAVEWSRRTGTEMSRSAMVRALQRAGLTTKKSPSAPASASAPTLRKNGKRSGMK
jgi:transposase